MAYTFGQEQKSLQSILDDYNRRIQVVDAETSKGWHAILDFYGNLPDWKTAIEEAGKLHFDASGKCHDHQYRIYRPAKDQFLSDLREHSAAIQNSANFEELYDNIERFCKKSGIGELAVYDTALRLGAFLGKHKGGSFKPHEVFLHNGAMKGAMVRWSYSGESCWRGRVAGCRYLNLRNFSRTRKPGKWKKSSAFTRTIFKGETI